MSEHLGPKRSVSRTRIESEVDKTVDDIEVLAIELTDSVKALKLTIKTNRRDLMGIRMRSNECKDKGDKLIVLALRASKLRDLLYEP